MRLLLSLIAAVVFATNATCGTLLQEANLVYEGAFRVPQGNLGGDSSIWSFGRGGDGITYNAASNTLILFGSVSENYAIEISIPTPVDSTDITALNSASVVQVPGDIANSQWNNLNLDHTAVSNGGAPGSLLVYDGELIGNAYAFYPGSSTVAHLSHFTASLSWATEGNQFSGFDRVGIEPTGGVANSNGGWVGGYLAIVPDEWREALGFPVLTGNGGLPIITRASHGPSLWGFDPNTIDGDVGTIADAEIFVGYDSNHQTLGEYGYGVGSLLFNNVTHLTGAVFPSGSDSVLVFGMHGLGKNLDGASCYGTGTDNESLHGTEVVQGESELYCYDPVDGEHGTHAYPYVSQVWAYDANDFVDVKNGVKEYWEVVPYAYWVIDLPFAIDTSTVTGKKAWGGVAYDPVTQRLFVSQLKADHWADQYEPNPIIHVFSIPALEGTIPPASGSIRHVGGGSIRYVSGGSVAWR